MEKFAGKTFILLIPTLWVVGGFFIATNPGFNVLGGGKNSLWKSLNNPPLSLSLGNFIKADVLIMKLWLHILYDSCSILSHNIGVFTVQERKLLE